MAFWPFSLSRGGRGSETHTARARSATPSTAKLHLGKTLTEQEAFDELAEQVMVWVLLILMLGFLLNTCWNYYKTKKHLRQNYELKRQQGGRGEEEEEKEKEAKEKGN